MTVIPSLRPMIHYALNVPRIVLMLIFSYYYRYKT